MMCLQHDQGIRSSLNSISLNRFCSMSKKYTTINTTNGIFQYERLLFGISSAPAIFQRTMKSLLQDLPGVCVYMDDILVTGINEEDHLNNLNKVMS